MKKDLDSLIRLLDDPDEEVFTVVQNKLFTEGISVIKKLESVWERSEDPTVQKRIEQLSHDIHFKFIVNEFKGWINLDDEDLLFPLLIISKFQFPDLDIEQYRNGFLAILREVEAELTPGLTPLEQVKIIDHILFQEHKFVRTFTGFKSPENYLISNLVTSGKGNIMSLTLFYIIVGQQLQLPLYGINLPDNFAVAYVNPHVSKDHFDRKDVMFYINPANKGAVFSKLEIDDFLKRIGRQKSESYYTPISNQHSLEIYMESLLKSFKDIGNSEKYKEFSFLLNILRKA